MRKETLMLVDDDQLEHIKLKTTLSKLGFDFPIASSYDGEEALQYLKAHRHQLPRLILLDLNMPRIGGLEFLECIKSDSLFKRIPVVILTTSNASADRDAGYDNQAAGYMLKPDEFDSYQDLISIIAQYWQTSKVAS